MLEVDESQSQSTTQSPTQMQRIESAQTVQLKSSQITLILALVTILFLILNFVINYVERATSGTPTVGKLEIPDSFQAVLNQQTAILSSFQTLVNQDHELLVQRTATINAIAIDAAATKQMLITLAAEHQKQTEALSKQTETLQKLSIWLDIQIRKGK